MAVATTATEKIGSTQAVTMYDHDPDGTAATDVGWVDLRDYESFMVLAFASTLTGAGATAFMILANSESDGSGTDVEIKAHAVGSAPNAVGDYLVLECTAEEIADAGTSLRYVSASLTMANSADENVVVYIRANSRHPRTGLTSDTVS